MKFSIKANVRPLGSQGIFKWHRFSVDAENADNVKDAWFDKFGPAWELHHFDDDYPPQQKSD